MITYISACGDVNRFGKGIEEHFLSLGLFMPTSMDQVAVIQKYYSCLVTANVANGLPSGNSIFPLIIVFTGPH